VRHFLLLMGDVLGWTAAVVLLYVVVIRFLWRRGKDLEEP